ncbi:uncharacterized protein J3R85_003447 [Psidium guajava]|nr:uncharacterized protein J3R85_003447 [Psidium guajava]
MSIRSPKSSPSPLRTSSLRLVAAMAMELEPELSGRGGHEPWARAPRPWPTSSLSLVAKLELAAAMAVELWLSSSRT